MKEAVPSSQANRSRHDCVVKCFFGLMLTVSFTRTISSKEAYGPMISPAHHYPRQKLPNASRPRAHRLSISRGRKTSSSSVLTDVLYYNRTRSTAVMLILCNLHLFFGKLLRTLAHFLAQGRGRGRKPAFLRDGFKASVNMVQRWQRGKIILGPFHIWHYVSFIAISLALALQLLRYSSCASDARYRGTSFFWEPKLLLLLIISDIILLCLYCTAYGQRRLQLR